MIAKQRAYARHAPLLQSAIPLPQELMEMSLTTCFEAQVAKAPHRIAVVSAQGTLTYQALNWAANRLAHQLLAMGIPIGAPVAILLEQSAETVVSIWGAVKAGGCYFCLEPSLPAPRTQDLLQRSAAQIIITTSTFAAYAEQVAPTGSHIILLDQMVASDLVQNPNIPIAPGDALAINFTSGSTGTPKFTKKSHAAQLYSAWQCSIDYGLSPADRYASIYQLNAGLSSRGIFAGLLTGGTYYLYPGMNFDMSGWANWLEAEEITQLTGPTAAIRELLYTRPDGPNFPAMRIVQVAGQTVFRQDAELFQRRFAPGAILVSLYGMTELATITHYLVDHDTRFEGDTLPIGYPVAGRQLLVMDEAGNQLIDQPGELVLRHRRDRELLVGDVPTRCHHGQEVDEEAYALFYTADIGIQRADGCLTYLGRKDDMVKVRGNRVTLTEIESWLLKIKGVAQAAAKSFPTASGDNRVVGYVALAPGVQITEASIRAELNQSIPFYMVPARVVVLPTMPMTTTGKVDRKTLPPPDSTRPHLATPFVAPRGEIEHQIADLWMILLGLDEIGVDDNFFELGGDSLNAVRMIVMIEAKLGVTIAQDYFRAPTVAALAKLCTADASDAPSARTSTAFVAPTEEYQLFAANPGQSMLRRLVTGQVSANNALRRMIHISLPQFSYAQGTAWLTWLARPSIAKRLFGRERQWFDMLADEMDNPSAATDEAFAVSLVGNLIRDSFLLRWKEGRFVAKDILATMQRAPEKFWRTFAQQFERSKPGRAGARFHVYGLEHLDSAKKEGRGTILLTYHSTASTLAGAILSHQFGIETSLDVSLEQAKYMARESGDAAGDATTQARASSGWAATYTLQAQRILQQGGIVRIANDVSYDEANSLAKMIGPRQHYLKPGFAELALTTNASVLPYYNTFDRAGGVHTTILPPLVPPSSASGRNVLINALMDQYIAFLEATWRKSPESLGWGALSRYHQCRLVGSPIQSERSPQVSRG